MIDLLLKTKSRKPKLEYAEKLWEGSYFELFNINQFEYFTLKEDYLFIEFHRFLTRFFSDLVMSGSVTITGQNDSENAKINELLTKTKLIPKLKVLVENASVYGDSIAQIVITDNQIQDIIIHETENWTPIPDSRGESYPPIGHVIWREFKKDNKIYCLAEAHTAGLIKYTAYQNDKQVNVLPLFAEELKDVVITPNLSSSTELVYKTGFDFPLVFQFKNIDSFSCNFGESDYRLSSVSKVKKINELLNQRQYVIRQHGNPKMVVPKSLISQAIREYQKNNQTANQNTADYNNSIDFEKALNHEKSATETYIAQQIVRKMEFMPDDSIDGTSQFRYIEYNGKLEDLEKQLITLKNELSEENALPKLLLEPEVALGNLSGVALKRLMAQTLSRVQEKRESIIPTIKEMIKAMLIISGEKSASYPTVQFGEVLPESLLEKANAYQVLLSNNLISQKQAIQDVFSTSPEKADSIQAEIRGEQNYFNDSSSLMTQNV